MEGGRVARWFSISSFREETNDERQRREDEAGKLSLTLQGRRCLHSSARSASQSTSPSESIITNRIIDQWQWWGTCIQTSLALHTELCIPVWTWASALDVHKHSLCENSFLICWCLPFDNFSLARRVYARRLHSNFSLVSISLLTDRLPFLSLSLALPRPIDGWTDHVYPI